MADAAVPDGNHNSDPESLLRQACALLNRGVRAGNGSRAEQFLAQFPSLADDADRAVELIYTEFVAREHMGEQPRPEEFLKRFPRWQHELAAQFQVHRLLDGQATPAVPHSLGAYDLLDEIARGSSGVVYRARHRELNRLAAIKVVAVNPGDAEAVARFRAEAAVVARLSHPHIVQIYEVGTWEGRPYLVLEYLAGGNLAGRLRGEPLPPHAAAELTETLARAVDYAHRQGIVHRDLKPANVLVQTHALPPVGLGVLKIADFGLARVVDRPGAEDDGQIAGTPSYMAPEQVRGDPQIGPAADIYALGAILYELLTGRPPFRADTPLHTLGQVLSADPVPPRDLQPGIAADLETICLKCLAKEARLRYERADELADDLRRFLNGEPIRARPAGTVERAWKWARRHPARAGLLMVSLVASFAIVAGSVWTSARLDRAAREEGRLKREALDRAAALRAQLDASRKSLYTIQLAHVEEIYEDDPGRALALLEDEQACPPDLRDFAWGMLYNLCRRDRLLLRLSGSTPAALAFSADGRTLLAAADQTVEVWNAETGERQERTQVPAGVRASYRNPKNGELLLALQDGSLRSGVNDRKTATTSVAAAQFSPDGTAVALVTTDGTVRLVDTLSGKQRFEVGDRAAPVQVVAFAPDGKHLAVADADAVIGLLDTASGAPRRRQRLGQGTPTAIAFSPDGSQIAVTSAALRGSRTTLQVLDGKTLEPGSGCRASVHPIRAIAFAADGQSVAAAGEDRTVRIWDLPELTERERFRGHNGIIRCLAFAPDGRALASAADDGTVRVWPVATSPEPIPAPEPPRKIIAIALGPDGSELAAGRDDGTVTIHDGRTLSLKQVRIRQEYPVLCLASNKTGCLAVGDESGQVRIYDGKTGNLLARPPAHGKRVRAVTWSPDGSLLASAGEEGSVHLWDLKSGKPIASLEAGLGPCRSVGFTPDGSLLATGNDNGWVCLWDVATRKESGRLATGKRPVLITIFSPDGKTLACGGLDSDITLWDVATRTRRATLSGHTEYVFAAAFTPDGRTLATGSGNRFTDVPGEVKLWDVATGHIRATLAGQTGPVAFTPDGRALVTVDQYVSLKLWPARRP